MNSQSWIIKNKSPLLFGALLFYFYFRGIGDHGLIDPIEGINASIELHMLASGNYFVPRIGSALATGKSAGTWWLSAFALKIFGWGEFAVRFWSALSGLGMAFVAAMSARRNPEDSEQKAWLAAVICSSMTLCFTVSQIASSHALYACLTGFAMMGLVRYQDNRQWLILTHTASVLALIVHGPEGIILPFLTVFIFAVLNNDFSQLKDFLTWTPGIIISILGTGLYFILLINENPLMLHFMRCEAPGLSSGNFLGALIFIIISFTPWHGFLLRAIIDIFPKEFSSEYFGFAESDKNDPRLFMLLWASVFGTLAILMKDFLAFASCVPALSALLGDMMDIWLNQRSLMSIKKSVVASILILIPMIFLLLPFALTIFPELRGSLMSLIPWGAFVLIFLFACWYYTKTKQIAKWVRNVPAAALLCLMPLAGVFNLTAEAMSIRSVGLRLRDTLQRSDSVAQYGVNYPSVYFYTLRDSSLIDAGLIPGVEEKKFVIGEQVLRARWTGRERVFLIVPVNKSMAKSLPKNAFHIMEADGVFLLSNK